MDEKSIALPNILRFVMDIMTVTTRKFRMKTAKHVQTYPFIAVEYAYVARIPTSAFSPQIFATVTMIVVKKRMKINFSA